MHRANFSWMNNIFEEPIMTFTVKDNQIWRLAKPLEYKKRQIYILPFYRRNDCLELEFVPNILHTFDRSLRDFKGLNFQ